MNDWAKAQDSDSFIELVEERWHNPQQAQQATYVLARLDRKKYKTARELTNAVKKLIVVPSVRYDPHVRLTMYLRCLPTNIKNMLVNETSIEVHDLASFSKKAVDLEAKLGGAQQVVVDRRKKKVLQDWKKKGSQLIMIDSDGNQGEIDGISDLVEDTELGGEESVEGGNLTATTKLKADGQRKGGQQKSQGKAQVSPNAPAWVRADLEQDVWRDRYTRGVEDVPSPLQGLAEAIDSLVIPQTCLDQMILCSLDVFEALEDPEEWSGRDPREFWVTMSKGPREENFAVEVIVGGRMCGAFVDNGSTWNFISRDNTWISTAGNIQFLLPPVCSLIVIVVCLFVCIVGNNMAKSRKAEGVESSGETPQVKLEMIVQPVTPVPPDPLEAELRAQEEKLRLQTQAVENLKAELKRKEEYAQKEARRKVLIGDMQRIMSLGTTSQASKDMAEFILLQDEIHRSYFTNWDDRISGLETSHSALSKKLDDISPQLNNIAKQLQITPVQTVPLSSGPSAAPVPKPPHSRPSSPPLTPKSPAPSQSSAPFEPQRPKLTPPPMFSGEDPKVDVADWVTAQRTYLSGFTCDEDVKVSAILARLERTALQWCTSTSSKQGMEMADWAQRLGVAGFLQALQDWFADKEQARKAADKMMRLGQKKFDGSLSKLYSTFESLTSTPGLEISEQDLLIHFLRAVPEQFQLALFSQGHKNWRSFGRAGLDLESKLHEKKKHKSELILLRPYILGAKIKGVLDCGATRNFISPKAVSKLHLDQRLVKLRQPLEVRIGDSSTVRITTVVKGLPVSFDKQGEVRHRLNFYVFPNVPFDLVFSMQWLGATNPRIDWRIPRVELPDRHGVYRPCMLADEYHLVSSCYCMSARKFLRFSRQTDHARLFVAYVKQTDVETAPCPFQIQQVVDRFSDLMEEPTGLFHRQTKHKIEILLGSVPPKGRVYRMSPAELEELRKHLETLTRKGWIRPNTSEFGAPVLFVPKGNGEFRMCVDYRGLNKITRKSTEPLPRIDDLLDMVQGCTIFSKIDLKSGYHQIEMVEGDVHKTAFKTRKFIKNFSAIAAPLTDLTKKDTSFLWTSECQEAFTRLKEALIRAPVLKLPDPTLPFVLTTDASQYGVGAVLQQDDGNGLQPIEYMSKKIKTKKLQDSTYEKELYALVSPLKHWKHFLLGRHFKIFSDHSTLQWMKSQGELNDKLARYIQFIDMFDFELRHKKGCYNRVADALSRRPDALFLISFTHSFGERTRQTIAQLLPQDEIFGPIVRNL
ncbi:hypothetical protein CBR_g12639 [Chara braunii]|uniref:Reverse transcriptase/retrotransposon-derived protein RNase H-like domain-containing protein n=1 Tax=Chara braunii TaxID=69332 RepID=A0A388KSE4_CHABU|nr:hypothetical protein CBR_g12639 [Chara braunii]|eukprot:GBG72918.1 hypothetical protein CBR_g12639 [Chara braunii]